MRVLVLSVMLLALSANGADAARCSLGANLGVTFFSFDESESNYLLVGLPSQGFLTILPPPGFRLGIAPQESPVEFFLDMGFLSADLDGASFTAFQLGGNVQYNFSNAPTHPYVTVGAGMSRVGSEDFLFSNEHAVAPTFGAGLGLRHRLSHGFGTLRAEIRYDRLVEDADGIFFSDGNSIALKLGFDVWVN